MDNQTNRPKRALEQGPGASLIDVMTGDKFNIESGHDYIIGRALNCTLLIEELFISRIHCVIKYENNHFVIYDHSTSSATFLNFGRMNKKNGPHVLNDGDIIAFGDKKKLEYIYKFSLVTSSEKKCKAEEDTAIEELKAQNEKLKSELAELNDSVTKLNIENNNLKKTLQDKDDEFKKTINELKSYIEINAKNVANDKYNIESLKSQVHSELEENFQCYICNEIVVKATTGSCNHTFCENCISTWLNKSSLCPVCRAFMRPTYNCLAVDNFIADICELLGGYFKEQRDNLQKERNVETSARVRPRLNLNAKRPTPPTLQERPRVTSRVGRRARNIEVVDLTHLG